MKRREFLSLLPVTLAMPLPVFAANRVFYTPGVAEKAMDAGKVLFINFWTNWCPTCAAQLRVIEKLRDGNPAYDKAITFITVDWDIYADGDLAKALQIPARSTIVALKGKTELGRILDGTGVEEIKALMNTALGAATA